MKYKMNWYIFFFSLLILFISVVLLRLVSSGRISTGSVGPQGNPGVRGNPGVKGNTGLPGPAGINTIPGVLNIFGEPEEPYSPEEAYQKGNGIHYQLTNINFGSKYTIIATIVNIPKETENLTLLTAIQMNPPLQNVIQYAYVDASNRPKLAIRETKVSQGQLIWGDWNK